MYLYNVLSAIRCYCFDNWIVDVCVSTLLADVVLFVVVVIIIIIIIIIIVSS